MLCDHDILCLKKLAGCDFLLIGTKHDYLPAGLMAVDPLDRHSADRLT